MGKGHLLGQRHGAADQAFVITPSAHISVHLGHVPLNTSIRESLPWFQSLHEADRKPSYSHADRHYGWSPPWLHKLGHKPQKHPQR